MRPDEDDPERPLAGSLTGDRDSGGLAGQGGMTDADDDDDQDDEGDEP